MKIEIPYYEDNTRISNSAIGWFLKQGPRYYRDMLDGKEEGLSAKFLDKGTMIHMYILQPEEFWDNYEVWDFQTPKSKQQTEFCEAYVASVELDHDKQLLTAFNKAYKPKKGEKEEDRLILAKALFVTMADYIERLKDPKAKKGISFAELNMLKTIKKNVAEHKLATKLLSDDMEMCLNEFHINWEFEKLGLSLKSLLDRVKIDHTQKKIIIIDLKTTVNVWDFAHSVETYQYHRQIAFYILAIVWYLGIDQKINCDDYEIEAYIIAIQNNGKHEVRVFDMNNETELIRQGNIITDALKDIAWHIENNLWDHTREYYEGTGEESLYQNSIIHGTSDNG